MRAFRRGSPRGTATAGFPEPVDAFAVGVAEVLGDQLVGVYLHGSLALEAYDPANSDVDFLVATEHELSPDAVEALAALHERLGDRLDGSYLPRDVFRRFDPTRRRHPHIEARGGTLIVDDHGSETVIYRYVLRKCGIAVVGPVPQELIAIPSTTTNCARECARWSTNGGVPAAVHRGGSTICRIGGMQFSPCVACAIRSPRAMSSRSPSPHNGRCPTSRPSGMI